MVSCHKEVMVDCHEELWSENHNLNAVLENQIEEPHYNLQKEEN